MHVSISLYIRVTLRTHLHSYIMAASSTSNMDSHFTKCKYQCCRNRMRHFSPAKNLQRVVQDWQLKPAITGYSWNGDSCTFICCLSLPTNHIPSHIPDMISDSVIKYWSSFTAAGYFILYTSVTWIFLQSKNATANLFLIFHPTLSYASPDFSKASVPLKHNLYPPVVVHG